MSSARRFRFFAIPPRAVAVAISVLLAAVIPGAAATKSLSALQKPVTQAPLPPTVQSELKSKDPAIRRKAANEVGVQRLRAAMHPLMDLLFDGDSSVKEAAAFALGQIADPLAARSLIYVLNDKDPQVRSSAAFALGMIEDTESADELSKLLDDSEIEVRASAVFALGLMRDDAAVDELIDALDDSAFDVRYDAVWALGRIGETDAVERLRASLVSLDLVHLPDSSREAFRQAVQSALDNIDAQNDQRTQLGSSRPRRAGNTQAGPQQPEHASRFASVRQSVMPARTDVAATAGVNTPVSLRVLVGADGRAVRAYVTRRVGYGLDRRAVEAVLQYKFDPGLHDGLPQTEWMNLDVQFPEK
jgi:hypothetical protein